MKSGSYISISILLRDVRLRTITPGLIAKLVRADEILQKEASVESGSLFRGKIEKTVPKGKVRITQPESEGGVLECV